MGKDEPRSSLEIAMERLRVRDQARGTAPPRRLTEKEKARISEVRSFYDSKIAEREILFQDEFKKAGFEVDKREEVEKAYLHDRGKLEAERDRKIAEIHG